MKLNNREKTFFHLKRQALKQHADLDAFLSASSLDEMKQCYPKLTNYYLCEGTLQYGDDSIPRKLSLHLLEICSALDKVDHVSFLLEHSYLALQDLRNLGAYYLMNCFDEIAPNPVLIDAWILAVIAQHESVKALLECQPQIKIFMANNPRIVGELKQPTAIRPSFTRPVVSVSRFSCLKKPFPSILEERPETDSLQYS